MYHYSTITLLRHIVGAHLTMFYPPMGQITPLLKQVASGFFPSLFLHPEERKWWKPLAAGLKNVLLETGYFHLQATKPDTVGMCTRLRDVSPCPVDGWGHQTVLSAKRL